MWLHLDRKDTTSETQDAGVDLELDVWGGGATGPLYYPSCERFLTATVCNRTYYRLGGAMAP